MSYNNPNFNPYTNNEANNNRTRGNIPMTGSTGYQQPTQAQQVYRMYIHFGDVIN